MARQRWEQGQISAVSVSDVSRATMLSEYLLVEVENVDTVALVP